MGGGGVERESESERQKREIRELWPCLNNPEQKQSFKGFLFCQVSKFVIYYFSMAVSLLYNVDFTLTQNSGGY